MIRVEMVHHLLWWAISMQDCYKNKQGDLWMMPVGGWFAAGLKK